MCGICGMAGLADRELLAQMTNIIYHRGPDDGGLYLSPDGQAGLGNRRLAIIDLSPAGHMPMHTEDEALWITYNGEVYNFPELRAHLQTRGYTFRSGTDTEVILEMYREYGVEAFKRLNGMFAIAIWDTRRQELTLARDRFGVKPLYYTTQDLIENGVNGLVVDPRDTLALAEAIARLIADPELRSRMGAAASATICQKATIQHSAAAFIRAIALSLKL